MERKLTMSSVTLHSLEALGEYFAHDDGAEESAIASTPAGNEAPVSEQHVCAAATPDGPNLAALLDRLTAAGAVLATLTQADQEARAAAADLLAQYEAIVEEQRQAEAVHAQACQVRTQAESLASGAFSDDGRTAAEAVFAVATDAERAAEDVAQARRAAAEALAATPALARLLNEQRQEEERRRAGAAIAEVARRLGESLSTVEQAMAAGRFEEASSRLETLAADHPNSAAVRAAQAMLQRRARRLYRQAPAEAIRRLEALDLSRIPEHIRHQITGVWTAACARLCRERGAEEPRLRYLPEPGQGVVVAREAAGQSYVVVSALGAGFAAGTPVDDRFVQRARPLRATGR
jgi:hypothetical protein